MERALTSEYPLQTVARRVGVAAKAKGRKREIATGAVRSIEGIIVVRVRGKGKGERQGTGALRHSPRGCCTACVLVGVVILSWRSGRTHAESIGPRTNLTALILCVECRAPFLRSAVSSNSPYAIPKDRGQSHIETPKGFRGLPISKFQSLIRPKYS